MEPTLTLTLYTPEGVQEHFGTEADELWDMVDTSIHTQAVLQDANGNLICKYAGSEPILDPKDCTACPTTCSDCDCPTA